MEFKRILVLDGDMIPALTVARALHRSGLSIDLGCHLSNSLTSFSNATEKELKYPNPLTDEQAFIRWLIDIYHTNTYGMIIPVTERTLIPLVKASEQIGAEFLPLPTLEALNTVLDKSLTIKLADDLGITTPASILVSEEKDLDLCGSMPFPIVIKPARSIGNNEEHRKQLSVDYAFNKQELKDKTLQHLAYTPVLIQEYFKGQGVGIELIANNGTIEYSFQHLRLHEVPLTGGGSSYRKSVAVEPILLDASQKLIKALNWHGVVMVEFKWRPDTQEYRLMEINGRFWGSLPLALASKANFPLMLYELFKNKAIKKHEPYSTGVYCRNLSRDIQWLEHVLRKNAPPELYKFPSISDIGKEYLHIFLPKHKFDVQTLSDIKPGIHDLREIVIYYYDRIKNILIEKRKLKHYSKKAKGGSLVAHLTPNATILFLCYGNINRSAIAECLFNKIAPDMGFKVKSAGLHQVANRPADPVMVNVAKQSDINLSSWSSTSITQEMIESSDIIFAMETRHCDAIIEKHPQAAEKCFLLGMTAGSGEISDPYGLPPTIYENCFKEVENNIQEIVKIMKSLHN